MLVEILYFNGCPHHRPTVDMAREVVEELGLTVDLREVEVQKPDDAVLLRFLGSPSIRVDGVDIEPGAEERKESALSCRMYGGSGIPPRQLLVAALQPRT